MFFYRIVLVSLISQNLQTKTTIIFKKKLILFYLFLPSHFIFSFHLISSKHGNLTVCAKKHSCELEKLESNEKPYHVVSYFKKFDKQLFPKALYRYNLDSYFVQL